MASTVGVFGLPELAGVLRDAGYDVFGADITAPNKWAVAVNKRLNTIGAFSIIVASTHIDGIWINAAHRHGVQIVVVEAEGPAIGGTSDVDWNRVLAFVETPATVDGVVNLLGFPSLLDGLGEAFIDPDGSIVSYSDGFDDPGQSHPDDDAWEDSDDEAWDDSDDIFATEQPGSPEAPEPVADQPMPVQPMATQPVALDTEVDVLDWALDKTEDPRSEGSDSKAEPNTEPDAWDDPDGGDGTSTNGPDMDEDIDYDDPEDAFVESNPAPRPAPRRTRRPERPAPAATGGTSGRVVRPPTGQSSSGNPRAPRPPAKTPVVVPPVAGPPRRARTDSTGRPEREGRRERPTRPERPARPEQAEARRPRRERPTPPPPPVEEYEDYEDDEYADEDDGFDSGFPEPARTQRPAPPVEEYEDYEDDEYADEDDDEYEDDEPAALEVFDKPSRKARPAPEPDPVPNRPRKRQMRYSDTPVVVACAFKGGVGKTTMAMGLAQRAAEHGGKRVIVVDANRGQSDITTYLRLGRAKLPTIWDAARTGDPRKGFAQPSEINKARHAKLEQIPFGLVLGPPATKADPRIVTAEVYRDVIETARRAADLVILDTQIIEAHDTSGLIDGLVIPILQGGGWAVAISDLSSASVKNAHTGTERFKSAGVPVDRLLMLLNRVDASANVDLHELGNSFRDRASLIGSITADAETVQAMNQGQIVSDAPDMAELFDEILFRITADEVFDPAQHTGFMEAGRGFLGRLFGRNR